MNFQKFFFVFMMSLASTYAICDEPNVGSHQQAIFSINPLEDGLVVTSFDDAKRGYLSVPASVNLGSNLSAQILSPTTLGVTTTNLSLAGLYRLTKNSTYTPAITGGSPAIRISGTGVDLDFSHNSFCFSRSTSTSTNACFPSATSSSSSSSSTCNTHCVGIEIGYGPNFASGITQPDNVVVENGIMCNWDIAILIHAGVRNVIIRNMVFTDNVIPIIAIGQNNAQGILEKDISNITLENVSILGANQAQLTCLKWIRMYLSNGAVIPPISVAATGPEGYVNNEVMLLEGNPVEDVYPDYITFGNTNNDVGLGLYVYPGIYFYGVTNVSFNNVSISNIGFDGNLTPGEPSAVAERTAAYGMWFRNCTSIFMQDVDASYTRSGLVAVGAYFDDCEVISIKNGQFTQTGLNLLETAYPTPVFTPEGLWAAGMVLKDSNSLNMSHVVLSHTLGLDSAWGLRTIHSYYTPSVITYPLYSPTIEQYSQNFEFADVWADSLRGDHVFGYDFGDVYRKVLNTDQFSGGATYNGLIPSGAIHALKMHNVSSCSCLGKLGLTSELLIAKEYKGIYLGDQSSAIRIDGVRIEGNNIASGSTVIGINSGIEFGAVSTVLNNPAQVGQAQGTIFDASFNNVNIARNIGGYQKFEFCGMRAVSTGMIAPQVAGVNTFDTISITNSRFDRNQFEGFRAVDDIDNLGPITIQRLVMNNVSLSNNTDGHGATFQTLVDSDLVKLKCNLNNTIGFSVQTLIDSVSIVESEFNGTTSSAADVIGFDIATAGNCVNFVKTKFGFNSAVDGNATGLHVVAGQSISLKDCAADCNGSTLLNLVGPFTTRGIFFDTSIDNVEFLNVEANNNESGCGNCYGFEIDRATAIYADGMHANNNQAAGVITQNNNVAQVCGIFFKAAVGSAQSEGCYLKDLQACGNFNAYQAFGIHMQSPTGIVMENIDASSNLSDATGQINNLPVLSQAIGLFMEGGNSVSICDLHTNSNQQAEINAVNLSRYLSLGITSADSEANLNLSGFIAHHFPVANLSGAYGTFINGTNDLMIEHGSSGKNEGVRAFGMHARNAVNVFVKDIDASENHGLGTPWFTENPFAGFNPTAISIPNVQAQCFFGGLDPAAKINLQETFEYLLQGLAQVANQEAASTFVGGTDNVPAQLVTLSYTLMWSTLAQFRRFCTGVGFGFYASDFPTLEKCRALGNYSENDSGGGIALYGSAQGALVCDCVTADNRCYDVSERGGEGSFNINGSISQAEWNKLYTFLNVGLLNSQTLVTVSPTCSDDQYGFIAIPDTIVTDTNINAPQAKPTEMTQPEQPCGTTDTWVLNPRDVTVGFPATAIPTLLNANTPLYNLVAPAPLGVGILVECQRDGFVGDNNSYGNKGNAGCCAGIMSDAGSATMFLDNKATSNAADVMGFAWGLADMSYSTPNIWYKNWMYANRVDTFMNSSYLITFDTIVSQNQQLPIVVIYPGSTEALTGALPLDNIIVSFVNDRQAYDCIADEIPETWKCLNLASPLGSSFSDEFYGGPNPFLQIQAQEKRQLDFGGFISNLAGTGTQTQRAAASAAYDYMKDPLRAIPNLEHISQGQGYVANDAAWSPASAARYLLVVASGTNALYVYNSSLVLQHTFTAQALFSVAFPSVPAGNALTVDTYPGVSNTYAVIGFDNGYILVLDISNATVSDWAPFTLQQTVFQPALGVGVAVDYVRFNSVGTALVALSKNGSGSAGIYGSFNTAIHPIVTHGSWVQLYIATATGLLVDLAWYSTSQFATILAGTKTIVVDQEASPSTPIPLNYSATTPLSFANNATCLSFSADSNLLVVGQENGTISAISSSNATISTVNWPIYNAPGLVIANGTKSDFVRVLFSPQSTTSADYFVVTTQNNEISTNDVIVRAYDLTQLITSMYLVYPMGDPVGLPLHDVASTTKAFAWSDQNSTNSLAVAGANGAVTLTPPTAETTIMSVSANNNGLVADAIAVNSLTKRLAVASTVSADCSIWDVSLQPAAAISISSAVATALFIGNPSYSAKLAWSLDGNYLYSLIANGTNLVINVIDTSSLPYTVTDTQSFAFTGSLNAVDIVTVDGNDYLAVALSLTPFVQIYEFNRTSLTLSSVSGSTFVTILDSHTTSGNSVAFNSFGTRLIVGATVSSGTNTLADVNVSNPASPVLVEYIPAHTGLFVNSVAFSSDDVTVASYGADEFIVLTDLTNELSPVTIATSAGIEGLDKLMFSPDGTRLVVCIANGETDIVVSVVDTSTLNAQTLLKVYNADPLVGTTFKDAAWDSFNNLYVAGTGSVTGLAQIDFVNPIVAQAAYQSLNPRTFDVIQLYQSSPSSCAFSQDGNYIFQVDVTANALLVYNTQGVVVQTFLGAELGYGFISVAAHPTQNMVVVGCTSEELQSLVMIDCSNVDPTQWAIFAGNYNAIETLLTNVTNVTALQFSPNGVFLTIGYTNASSHVFVALFEINDPFNPTGWTQFSHSPYAVGLAASEDNGITSISWKPDSSYFAVADQLATPTGVVYVFSPGASSPILVTLPNTSYNPTSVSFNFEGSLLAVVQANNQVVMLNSSNGTPSTANWPVLSTPGTFASLTDAYVALFHPTQNILLVGATATTSYILDCRDGNLSNWTVNDLTTTSAPAFAEGLNTLGLAWNATGTIAQWAPFVVDTSSGDVTQWAQVYTPVTNAGLTGFGSIAMNPAGNMLVSGSGNSSSSQIATWDVSNKTSTLVGSKVVAWADQVAWSSDGYYVFSAGVNSSSNLVLNVLDPNDLSAGPVATSTTIAAGATTAPQALAVITVNGVDYLAIGLYSSNTISIVQYNRTTATFTQLFNGLTSPLSSLTFVLSVAWNMNAAGVVTLLAGDIAGHVGYFTFNVTTPAITQNWNVSVHSGNPVTAVAISPDGTVLMSGDTNALLLQNNIAHGSLVVSATFPNSSNISTVAFSHDGQRLAVASSSYYQALVYNVSSLYTQVPVVLPTLASLIQYPLFSGSPLVATWDANDIDLFLSLLNLDSDPVGIGCINEINPLTFAIAQDMVNHSDNLQLGANIANSLCDFAQLTELSSLNITSSDISSAITSMQTYLASNPNNLMGAVRTLQATALGIALQASTSRSQASLASVNRMQSYMSVDLYHPIDAATIALSPAFGWPSELVESRAADIYLYTEEHLADDPVTVAPLSADPFLQAVATVINNDLSNAVGAGVDRGILVLQAAYPQATYPGLAAQIANVAYEYLLTNSDDILGATVAMTTAFVQAGITDPNNQLCLALGGYMVAYINAAQQLLTFGGMNSSLLRSFDTSGSPTVAAPAGSSGYDESYRLTTGMYDALRLNPSLTVASVLAGAPLSVTADYAVSTTLQQEIASALSVSTNQNYVNISTAIPTELTKALRYSIENNSAGIDSVGSSGGVGGTNGLSSVLYTDNLVSTTIAAAVVGSGWAREALNGDLSGGSYTGVINPISQATSMTTQLLLGVNIANQAALLLPAGYLTALQGSLLISSLATTYPAASVQSVFATNTFASLGAYLNALADDLLAQGFTTTTTSVPYTGLIAANTNYVALNAQAQAAVARAIVLRSLIGGNEMTARTVFSSATNSIIIASIVNQIMTGNFTTLYNAANYATGVSAAAPSFSSTATYALPIETKQQIAAVAVMFFDTINTVNTTAYSKINVMIKSAYHAATAVQGLTADQQAFMSVIGGLGACAAFLQDSSLISSSDQASQVGTQLALGLFGSGFMTAYDIGSVGQDGLSVDLSDQLLAAISSIIVLETCASTASAAYAPAPATAHVAKNIGAYAASLAYNQMFTDTLMRSVAVLATQYDVSYGADLIVDADSSVFGYAQAEAIAQSALGQQSVSRARSNVSQGVLDQLYVNGTSLLQIPGQVTEQAGLNTFDISWSPDGQYIFAACQGANVGENYVVAYDQSNKIVAQFSSADFNEIAGMNTVSARPSTTNTNSYVAVGFEGGDIGVLNITSSDPADWYVDIEQSAFVSALAGSDVNVVRFSPDGTHLAALNSDSSYNYRVFSTSGTITNAVSWTANYAVQTVSGGHAPQDLAWRDNRYFATVIPAGESANLWVDQVGTPAPVGVSVSVTNAPTSLTFFTSGGTSYLILGEAQTVDQVTCSGAPANWNTISGSSPIITSGSADQFYRVQVDPTGTYLAGLQRSLSNPAVQWLVYNFDTTDFTPATSFNNMTYADFNLSLAWNPVTAATFAAGGSAELAQVPVADVTDSPPVQIEMPPVIDVAWTPDGQYLLAACGDEGVYVYDVNMEFVTSFISSSLNENGNDAMSVSTRPGASNSYAAVGFSSGDVQVINISGNPSSWTVATPQSALQNGALFSSSNSIDYVRFSPNGQNLAAVHSSSTSKYAVINTSGSISSDSSWGTGSEPWYVSGGIVGYLLDIAWRDNVNFAMVISGTTMIIMDKVPASLANANTLTFALSENARSVAFSADGTQMAIGQDTGIVTIVNSSNATINTANWTISKSITLSDTVATVYRVAYHPSYYIVAATGVLGTIESPTAAAFGLLNLMNANSTDWAQMGSTTALINSTALLVPTYVNSGLAWNPDGQLFSMAGVSLFDEGMNTAVVLAYIQQAVSPLVYVINAFGNSVANIMENPASFLINPEQVPFFATNVDGLYGHPANLASQLAQFGGLTQAQAAALANRLYTYLAQTDYLGNAPHQDDTTGAASSVGGC